MVISPLGIRQFGTGEVLINLPQGSVVGVALHHISFDELFAELTERLSHLTENRAITGGPTSPDERTR